MANSAWPFRGDRGRVQTKITSSTTETIIVPGFYDAYIDVYCLIIANTSGTVCKVTVKDSDEPAGQKIVIEVPANDTRGYALPKDSAPQQTNMDKPWTATCGTSVDSIEITALFTKNS